jgi:hypothetical protein
MKKFLKCYYLVNKLKYYSLKNSNFFNETHYLFRIKQIEELKEKYKFTPYPSKYLKQTISYQNFYNKYQNLKEKEKKKDVLEVNILFYK